MDKSSLSKPMSDARNLLWVVTGLVISIIFFYFFGVLQENTFANIFQSIITMTATPVMQVQFIIIISVLIYALLWAHNGLIEIDAIEEWMSPPNFMPTKRFLFILGSIFIGIFISLLIVVATTFEFFAFAVLIYCLLDLILWHARLVELRNIISLSDADLKEKEDELQPLRVESNTSSTDNQNLEYDRVIIYREAITVFRDYYLDKRHYSRVMIEIIFTFIAIILFFQKNNILPHLDTNLFIITEEHFLFISYSLIWISFVIAEIIIHFWRRRMHNSLKALRNKLHELNKRSKLRPQPSAD